MKRVHQVVRQAKLVCSDFEKNSRWPLKVSAELLSKTLHNLGYVDGDFILPPAHRSGFTDSRVENGQSQVLMITAIHLHQ